MIKRTHRIINAETGEILYETVCTINGNEITGSINPFPYMHRKIRKMGMHPVKCEEEKNEFFNLYVK